MSERKEKKIKKNLKKLTEFYINQYIQMETFFHRLDTAIKIIRKKKVSFKVGGHL